MVQVNKIDSNNTGLRYAEEDTLGVLPGSPVWHALEPNSYDSFGGEITTVARNPINAGRQRQKGVVVDLDASGGLNSDLTQDNLQDILQGFMFADLRRKGEEVATDVETGAEGVYGLAETEGFYVSSLVFANGFTNIANNGLKLVEVVTPDTSITVSDGALVDETPPADNLLVVAGHQFNAGELDVDSAGVLPQLLSTVVAATGTLDTNDAEADDITDETSVTIDGVVYTFETTIAVANDILIGASDAEALENLQHAINGTGTPGTEYFVGTTSPHTTVEATNLTGEVLTFTARVPGAVGNLITLATDIPNSTIDATLAGGAGMAFTTLGLIPGEWIFIGGDSASLAFATPANNGFARVKSVEHDILTLDKTQDTMVTEPSTTETVQLFFGRVLKNEAEPTLQVRRSYNLERLLGAPDDAEIDALQSEYLVGAVSNELTFNFNTADKITVDLSFVATDNEQRTAAQGPKAGDRPALVSGDAFNTSNDFARLKMSVLDPADSNPLPLFAFLTEFTVAINNNVSPNKAISVLGAFDVTAGQFNVEGTATAYFANVSAVQAVRNNADVTLDFILVKANKGIAVDVPLIALGDGRLNIEQDQPITLPLSMPAAADRVFNHTLLMVFYDYLPDAADVS